MSTPFPPPSAVALLRMTWEDAIGEIHHALNDAGFQDIRAAHRTVLRDILTSGLRPTELAGRLGISKQAANDVLREFEAGGYITLTRDPDDGRAKRIVATERGAALVRTAARTSAGITERWIDRVGPERFAEFESVLREIATPDEDLRRTRDRHT
ncbi:MarR family winged helix-turn-helix transcriptional regulator [Patulibacter minatonensis]|uniref:MarR family winged helix-turn-helix transcriptional regulator n=1 Tax=Patulibacter minatonensis TaxID=298163 RepID=UPI0004AD3CE6|nr:MarR family transcriptional regulator [Patulibacter minatonensis]